MKTAAAFPRQDGHDAQDHGLRQDLRCIADPAETTRGFTGAIVVGPAL